MKRIAILTPGGIAPPQSQAHIPALTDFVERLSERADVTVFSLGSGRDHPHSTAVGNADVRFLETPWNASPVKRITALVTSVLSQQRRKQFEIVHGFWGLPCGAAAGLLGRLLNIQSGVSLLGGETASIREIPYGLMLYRSRRFALGEVLRRVDRVHVLSDYQRSQLITFGFRFKRLDVIPLGVDISRFIPARSSTFKPPYKLLHVANLTEVKDQKTLLHAFKIFSERVPARLRIIGPDHLGGVLQRAANDLGIRHIGFKGHIPHKRLPREYRWGHIFLHSSLHEAQSVAAVEAMASGLVVCGTPVGICADLSSSLVVTGPCGDPAAIASALLSLVGNRGRYRDLRARGIAWARAHHMGNTVERFLEGL